MDIVHNFKLNVSQENLFTLFSSASGINKWWSSDCEIAQSEGGICKLRFTEDKIEMVFQIDKIVEGKGVIWKCIENPNPAWLTTSLHFEIILEDSKSVFHFKHVGWDEKWQGELAYEQTKQGWEHFMQSLRSYCETGTGQPW